MKSDKTSQKIVEKVIIKWGGGGSEGKIMIITF
jgi:hypothetical protein